MSVSDKHGGGLTLQRVLGNDLNDIKQFIHLKKFAIDLPVKEELASRSVNFLSITESNRVRQLIGRSYAQKASNSMPVIKAHARWAAGKIRRLFKNQNAITALVCPQGANSIVTLEELKKITEVKYISWMMDDHLVSYDDGEWHYPPNIEEQFFRHLREAEHVFVISSAMQEFYKSRFGVDSTVLFGPAQNKEVRFSYFSNLNNKLKIGYFGAVGAWQLDALESVASAIDSSNVILDIYSGIEQLPDRLRIEGVNLKASIAAEDVSSVMEKYDGVLLPISFKKQMRNMSQLNIATKMSEYLASGVPILAVGPPYAAMIGYLEDNNAAFTVTSQSPNDIREGLQALRNLEGVQEILQNAGRLVVTQVGEATMRLVWQSVVNNGHDFK
ncbi:hypothetical protein DYU05_09420 [Mucilaginibacter terrenus]|uniref:Glycosyltransferase family 4 protein n=2 Tax=Mucilaginibacter terrenus TaxID=2482727 RepID=A0A3E2NXQ0_9SPHI|nr:hypothetical protein DYU05_09420 [Mucilaginibacter terrenus]